LLPSKERRFGPFQIDIATWKVALFLRQRCGRPAEIAAE
jgi:hypothetical protein